MQETQETRVWPLGGGHGNPLQYSCLGNPMDRGAWQVTVRRVAKSWTQLKRLSTHAGGLLSRQLQQPLCQMASLCSSTSSLYTSPFYSVPTKDAPTCLLVSSCVWPTEIIGRRWERGRVRQRFLCSPPQLSSAPPTKSLSSSPHRMLPAHFDNHSLLWGPYTLAAPQRSQFECAYSYSEFYLHRLIRHQSLETPDCPACCFVTGSASNEVAEQWTQSVCPPQCSAWIAPGSMFKQCLYCWLQLPERNQMVLWAKASHWAICSFWITAFLVWWKIITEPDIYTKFYSITFSTFYLRVHLKLDACPEENSWIQSLSYFFLRQVMTELSSGHNSWWRSFPWTIFMKLMKLVYLGSANSLLFSEWVHYL